MDKNRPIEALMTEFSISRNKFPEKRRTFLSGALPRMPISGKCLIQCGKVDFFKLFRPASCRQEGQITPVVIDGKGNGARIIAKFAQFFLKATVELLIRPGKVALENDGFLIVGEGEVVQRDSKTVGKITRHPLGSAVARSGCRE